MKSKIIYYLIICLAIGSLATECNEEPEPTDGIVTDFTIEPETGQTNITFEFDGSKSHYWYTRSHHESIFDIEIRWDFDYTGENDIDWDTEWSEEDIVTHQYTEAKMYRVLLEARYANTSDTTSKLVIVTENTPPVADFEGNPTSGTVPLNVNFTDQSINDPASWLWEFGNGASSTEQNPSYTYNEEGTYTVTLIVTNNYGSDVEEKVDYLSVTSGGLGIPCPGAPTVTDFEGNQYNTVLIGNQCWMKENLKTAKYNDGTPIPNVTDGTEWYWLTTGAYVWYENDITWKDKYGALYNFSAAVNPNGLCPTGWHVPTKNEMLELTDFIGGIPQDGKKIKSCRQVNSPLGGDCNTTEHPRWNGSSGNNYGTDIYGFSGSLLGLNMFYYGGTDDAVPAMIFALPFLIPGIMLWWVGSNK